MTASQYELDGFGTAIVQSSRGKPNVRLPTIATRYLDTSPGECVVCVQESEISVLVYPEDDLPEGEIETLGTRKVTTAGDTPVTGLPAKAVRHLKVEGGDSVETEEGPDGSVRVLPGIDSLIQYAESESTPDDEDEESETQSSAHELAKVHIASKNGGHWWDHFEDAEPPDHYHEPDIQRREEVPEEHLPDVPANVDWSKYRSYNCRRRKCQDPCLNRADSRYARYKLCRACYAKVDLDEFDPLTHQLPQWVRDTDADATAATSEDRSGRPPAMGAGARTAAHSPNPEGEGESSRDTHQPTSGKTTLPESQD